MHEHEHADQHDHAQQVGHEPAIGQSEAGGNAEALKHEPGHGAEHEITEEESEQHQHGPEQDVEQQGISLDPSTVQPIALEGQVGKHPERHRDDCLAHQDQPAGHPGDPHRKGDHRQHVGDEQPGDQHAHQAVEDRRSQEAHDQMARHRSRSRGEVEREHVPGDSTGRRCGGGKDRCQAQRRQRGQGQGLPHVDQGGKGIGPTGARGRGHGRDQGIQHALIEVQLADDLFDRAGTVLARCGPTEKFRVTTWGVQPVRGLHVIEQLGLERQSCLDERS